MNHTSRRLSSRALVFAAAIGMLFAFAFATGDASAKKKRFSTKTANPVKVYPVAGTKYVSDKTTISFRGFNPKKLRLRDMSVIGGKTGVHKGKKLRHSDGKGVSFVTKKPFKAGETIKVKTHLRIVGAKKGDFKYRVARVLIREDQPLNPEDPPVTDGLHSRPDLKPTTLDVTKYTDEVANGSIFYAPKQDGLAIADKRGRTTWFKSFHYPATGTTLLNFRAQRYRGRPVLTYWKGSSSVTGYSQIGSYEMLNRNYQPIESFTPGNGYKADIHEFKMTGRNTALVLSYASTRQDLRKVGGVKNGKILDNVIQEVDVKTGAVLFEWHSLGNVPFNTGIGQVPTDSKSAFDYFHANSIDTDGNSYLISSRRQSSIYRVDRTTGRIRWSLSGTGNSRNDFEMGEGTEFGYQHDAQRMKNGNISMFDNSNGRYEPSVLPDSSILVLRLGRGDDGKRTATLVKRYHHTPGIIAQSQGNGEPLSTGGFFVGWGQVPAITEFNAAGDVVFDATHTGSSSEEGVISSYRAFKMYWNGNPQGNPAIYSQATDTGAKVWASYNGSQKTRSWAVLTGPDKDNLAVVANSPWKDFETVIDTPALDAVVAVRALGGKGETIGQSDAVPVGKVSTGQDVPVK